MFESTNRTVSGNEIRRLKAYYAKRWMDPVARINDTFNVRRADGSLTKLIVPGPQQIMIRDGIIGKSRPLVGTGISYLGITNKGRQLGFSVILAAESILIAEEFPNTNIYYVATAADQASDWMQKFEQLCNDASHWPQELGGGPILNIVNVDKVFEKNINGTYIVGLAANPSTIRGKTGIHVIFDETAWAIRFKNQARETWKALKYIIRQGGSGRLQSTPRTADTEELFWGMYTKGEEGNLAIHTYYCPVITNWKELDLEEPLWIDLNAKTRVMRGLKPLSEKDIINLIERYKHRHEFEIKEGEYIKQKAEIPYWWVNLADLETDRAEDLEQFKQENLGIPLDESIKVIPSAWIYSNLNEGDEWEERPLDNANRFFMCLDFAQKNDITAGTIVEEIPQEHGRPIYVERKIFETQDKYPVQRDIIFGWHQKFKCSLISADNTGHGIPVCDFLVEKLRENSMDVNVLKRVNFGAANKEIMAQGFRSIVMPDAITGKSRYRWLYKMKKHEDAIKHCRRVEKEVLSNFTRYSGKMHGRDDHFWSKAQLALYEIPGGIPKAALGKRKHTSMVGEESRGRTYGQKFIQELDRRRFETNTEERELQEKANKVKFEKVKDAKTLRFAIQCLSKGVVVCRTVRRAVKPIHCANPLNCTNRWCGGFRYVKEISKRYGVDINALWQNQKVYPIQKNYDVYDK